MPAPSTVLYRRDLLGRLVAIGTGGDPKAYGAWSYRGDGALATEALKADGTAVAARSFAYDGLGRPVSIDEPALRLDVSYRRDGDPPKPYADGGIAAETVTWKPAGFPTGTTPPPGSTVAYTRDGVGRLTTARSGQRPALNVDAAYDGNGNLDSLAQAGMSGSYAYHNGTNRLASVAGRGYAHDAAGAVTSAAGTSLVRDPATGRMRRGTKGGQSLSVLRDGRGRIALTVQGAAKRLTLRDGQGTILLEREGTSLAAVHLHGATGRVGLWTGDTLHAVSKDLRGSTRLLYGSDGKAAAWLSYCAYGALDTGASSAGTLTTAIRNRYTGQDWLEPLALYGYGARLYDPALGRFLSPDPKDETPSPYMYVAADPVNAVDPDGRGKIVAAHKWRDFLILTDNRNRVVYAAKFKSYEKIKKRLTRFRNRYLNARNKWLFELGPQQRRPNFIEKTVHSTPFDFNESTLRTLIEDQIKVLPDTYEFYWDSISIKDTIHKYAYISKSFQETYRTQDNGRRIALRFENVWTLTGTRPVKGSPQNLDSTILLMKPVQENSLSPKLPSNVSGLGFADQVISLSETITTPSSAKETSAVTPRLARGSLKLVDLAGTKSKKSAFDTLWGKPGE